jgi:hypothetical protein
MQRSFRKYVVENMTDATYRDIFTMVTGVYSLQICSNVEDPIMDVVFYPIMSPIYDVVEKSG